MAKKPVKKVTKPAAAKKVVAAKKTVTAKKPVAVVAAPAAPMVSCSCSKGCGCFKKFVIFLLGAAVGAFACCHFVCGKDMGPMRFLMKRGPMENRFVNGCLDTSKIGCPERLQQVQLKDADKNGCITEEELKAEVPAPQAPAPAPRKLRMHR